MGDRGSLRGGSSGDQPSSVSIIHATAGNATGNGGQTVTSAGVAARARSRQRVHTALVDDAAIPAGCLSPVTAIVLALGAALAYGAADFLGGRASVRAHFAVVTAVTQATAMALTLVTAALVGGPLLATPLGWGALSGLGSGVGTLFLYRGLARARVAVVAPISGVLAAALPAGLALVLGERPAPVTVFGLALALPAVWLISGGGMNFGAGSGNGSGDDSGDEGRPSGILDGILAGVGFGLLFLALGQAGDSAGLWPVAAGQLTAFGLVAAVALRFRHCAAAESQTSSRSSGWSWWRIAVVCGVLSSGANVAFFAATTVGLLTIAAVLTSLYPAGTIVLARLVLNERISRGQGLGLALAGIAVVLITLG